MGNFSYFPLSADWIEDLDASKITILNEDAVYPKTKIQNIPMADTARATDPGSGVKVQFDFSSNKNPKFWCFLNHNIASGNWIVRSYNDAFVTPSGESQTVAYREHDAKLCYTSWTAKRYWEVDFSGCTYNDAFWEMGKILAGADVVSFSEGFSPGIDRGLGFDNIHNETGFGVIWSYIKREGINFLGVRWDPSVKSPLLDELLVFIRDTYGGAYPSVIIPDIDQAELYYMKNEDELRWREEMDRSIIGSCNMNFKELSRGKVQTG